jgi:OOP family OmpA-OmpF porin
MKKTSSTFFALSAIAAAAMFGNAAHAQEFVNPDWANHATYIGAGIGQSRARIDEQSVIRNWSTPTATINHWTSDERDLGYKLFVGKQLNRNFAIEGGFYDLGKFTFGTTTAQGGVLNGDVRYRGVNVDLVGILPFSERFSAYGKVGAHYSQAKTRFTGNSSFALTAASQEDKKLQPKVGLGLEFKLSEALALRGEIERYRVQDGLRSNGRPDLLSLNLVYKLGRPAARPAPAPAPYVAPVATPAPAPVVQPAPPPPPAPVPVSEKVSFAAEALFDFDKSVVKPEGKAALDDLLNKLQGMNTEVMVTVGHTDAVGSDAYNAKLSQRRAEAVKAYIVSKGVDGSRVFTEGKGESQPVADNKSSDGRAKNRRVTVEVVGTRTVTK